jgi:uncharacterized protein
MVSFDREQPASGPVIAGFSGNAYRVGDRIVPGGLWLTPETARDWQAPSIGALAAADLVDLLATMPVPEFLLLGSGASMQRPSVAFTRQVEAMGFGIEVMDSRAAARAWNVLRGEDRWIVAALMPLG